MAFTLLELAEGQQPTYTLTKSQRQQVELLLNALRAGHKTKAHGLSQEFYEDLLKPEAVTAAYFQVLELQLPENPNFCIIMDWLKDKYGRSKPAILPRVPLDEAVVLLLLAVTNTPHDSISYKRLRLINGQERECSTTYPLKDFVIRDFLAPFGHLNDVMNRAVIFHKHLVLGNPAATLGHAHAAKRARWLQEHEAWQAATRQHQLHVPAQNQAQGLQEQVERVSHATTGLYALCHDRGEMAATELALTETNLRKLAFWAEAPPNAFLKKLQEIYTQRLQSEQAQLLAERMAAAFQALVQELHRLAGKDWLKLWREANTYLGKQPLKQHLVQDAKPGVSDLIAAEHERHRRSLDKLAGAQHLAELHVQDGHQSSAEPAPELAAIVAALGKRSHLQALLQVALDPSLLMTIPSELLSLLESTFAAYADVSMSVVKDRFVQTACNSHQELAGKLMADLELVCNRLAGLAEWHRKLEFLQLLELYQKQVQEAEERSKLASSAFRNSVAGQYYKNQPGALF